MAEASEVNPFALHGATDRSASRRWALSAIVVVAMHVGLIAAGIAWYASSPPAGAMMPAIMVDMAPSAAAPAPQPLDVAPGPQMQQAEAPPPPPPPPEAVAPQPEQALPPTPLQDSPTVALPAEPKPDPAPQKPAPAQLVREPPRPELKKPKPVPRAPKKPAEMPAPQTSAPPAAARQARAAAAAAGAAASAALPSYRDRLAAHLQRYKQYPSEARSAGVQGTAMLSFTVGRGGQLLSARLAASSGNAALDAETLAMVRRAQPLPSFPPEIAQNSLSFTVPVRFSIR
ncbi:MAG TPA: energy transducer TonB [Rhodopseudomonas sp.]|uniref:energy transducer TonB n=1 Tax=Rhodopseudomonas sp. TaxID=1078 RepID=UPI002ED79D16